MRSCTSLIGCATILIVALVIGWIAHDDIARIASRVRGGGANRFELAASSGEDAASRAEAKIVSLGQDQTGQITLTPEELEGWVRYRLQGLFPQFLSDVVARIDDQENLVLAGHVLVDQVPGVERFGPAAYLLGDTAAVVVRGRLDSLKPGRGVLYVEALQIGPVPLPDRLRVELLAQMGGSSEELPANAVAFELPEFVTDIGVRGGQIFLRGRAAAGTR